MCVFRGTQQCGPSPPRKVISFSQALLDHIAFKMLRFIDDVIRDFGAWGTKRSNASLSSALSACASNPSLFLARILQQSAVRAAPLRLVEWGCSQTLWTYGCRYPALSPLYCCGVKYRGARCVLGNPGIEGMTPCGLNIWYWELLGLPDTHPLGGTSTSGL